jgi:glucan phosphorylase
MRILMDGEGLVGGLMDNTVKTFGYTNHTILQRLRKMACGALEKVLPRTCILFIDK